MDMGISEISIRVGNPLREELNYELEELLNKSVVSYKGTISEPLQGISYKSVWNQNILIHIYI